MWGMGLDAWNSAQIVFLSIAAAAAILVGVSQFVIIKLQKFAAIGAEGEFKKYKLTVEGQVADAKKEGIEAGKTAGNALVRAAELEKEAANARLETEKIKAVVTWRMISALYTAELERVLAAKPGSVHLRWQDGDPEGHFFWRSKFPKFWGGQNGDLPVCLNLLTQFYLVLLCLPKAGPMQIHCAKHSLRRTLHIRPFRFRRKEQVLMSPLLKALHF